MGIFYLSSGSIDAAFLALAFGEGRRITIVQFHSKVTANRAGDLRFKMS